MRFAGLWLALALGMTAAGACTLELDRAIACGDGYVDHLAGEECDPLVESSYANACLQHPSKHEGVGACDPRTCQLDLSACALCGDGRRDPGEECDGNDFGGARCPIDLDGLRCTSDCKIDDSGCPKCGNGELDEGEECDFNAVGGIVMPRQCAGTDDYDALESPIPHYPYTFGTTTRCTPECRFNRAGCSYCGNNVIDGAILVDVYLGLESLPEVCDGERFDDDILIGEFGQTCYEMEGDLRPNVGCDNTCLGFVERPGEPMCCVKGGGTCPDPDGPLKCCFEYDHPDEDPCSSDTPFSPKVCRRGSPISAG